MTTYDIIGDPHGYFDRLRNVMETLGYRLEWGVYRHPEQDRRAIFLGDLIDRGPNQRTVIKTVKAMVEAGMAEIVMGNHDFNAVCYAMEVDGKPVRERSASNEKQLRQFLNEYPFGSDEFYEAVEWFKTFPLFTEKDGFRVIHAYWSDKDIENIRPYLNPDNTLSEAGYEAFARREEPFRTSLENILKGPSIKLPEGCSFTDRQGVERTSARLHWWDGTIELLADRFKTTGFSSDRELQGRLAHEFNTLNSTPDKPTFVGHYSAAVSHMPLLGENIVCVDPYDGLGAYTWRPGEKLSEENFIYSNGFDVIHPAAKRTAHRREWSPTQPWRSPGTF